VRDTLPEDRCKTSLTRVIGLGSPFGDDQVGWRVIELLRGSLPPDIELLALDRPGAALISAMQDVHWLVLVDALSSDAQPGRITRLEPHDIRNVGCGFSSHNLDLQQTLELAHSLDCMPARVDVYGIELGVVDGLDLSQEVAAAAHRLAARLRRDLRRTIEAAPPSGT
jgi:hydrogenase maturation protease